MANRHAGVIAVTFSLLLLAACGRHNATSDPAADSSSHSEPPRFALPFPVDRAVSAPSEMRQDGRDALLRSMGAAEDFFSLDLPAHPGGMEWAIYRFTP